VVLLSGVGAVHPRVAVRMAPQYVNRRAVPPSSGLTNTSGAPSRRLVHDTRFASGDNRGLETGAWSAVSRKALPPDSGASHTSSSATNVTESPRTAEIGRTRPLWDPPSCDPLGRPMISRYAVYPSGRRWNFRHSNGHLAHPHRQEPKRAGSGRVRRCDDVRSSGSLRLRPTETAAIAA